MKPAAITGASGFLGGRLLERLIDDAPLAVLSRRYDEISRAWTGRGCSVIYGDLDDEPALDNLVRDADTVYHCAATMAKGNARLSRKVNVDGTERLARAAARAGVRRFVYVSSISVFAATRRPDRTITETVQPEGVETLNAYSLTKFDGERVVRRISEETGLGFTIIRPTNIYGPGSGPWFNAFAGLLRRVPIAVGNLPINVVYVDDVVEALIRAARTPAAAGAVFHVGHETVKLSLFMKEVARVIGRKAHSPPVWLDRVLRIAIDRSYRAFTGSQMALSLVEPVHYPHDAARDCFGYVPSIGLVDGFERIRAGL